MPADIQIIEEINPQLGCHSSGGYSPGSQHGG
jgi:hypothetical protein